MWLTPGCETVKHCSIRMENQSHTYPVALSSSSGLGRRLVPEPTSRIGESQALTIPLAKNLSGNGLLKTLIL